MRNFLPLALVILTPALPVLASAQEGPVPTQVLVRAARERDADKPLPNTLVLKLDDKPTPVTSLAPVQPSGTQIALLIDDGLSRSAAVQLNDLKAFALALPPGTELLVGYMSNGTVRVLAPFTTDHAAAAKLRIPFGSPGQSGSPYFCLSDFVKHWPGSPSANDSDTPASIAPTRTAKARFVLMLTNGVDLYNGSVSLSNQDSPYVEAAAKDAQRAGVVVSSIYYRDAGFGPGGPAALSGQSYLHQVADATGGEAYDQGTDSPVALAPFLMRFTSAIAETHIAGFTAIAGEKDHLQRLKITSTTPKLKLRHPDEVRPGNLESNQP